MEDDQIQSIRDLIGRLPSLLLDPKSVLQCVEIIQLDDLDLAEQYESRCCYWSLWRHGFQSDIEL